MLSVRIRKLTLPFCIDSDLVLSVPKKSKIEALKRTIQEEVQVDVAQQKLYYGGKELTSDHTLADYKINNADVIQLRFTSTTEFHRKEHCREIISVEKSLINTTSNYYEVGDAIDVIYKELHAWFEARIVGILVSQNKDNFKENDLIFQVVMDRDEQTAPINVKFDNIRPRAKYYLELFELKPGMMVFVNYNIKKPRDRGYWYDLEVTKVDMDNLEGNILLGQNDNVQNCVIRFKNEVMKIEKPTLLRERIHGPDEKFPLRKLPLYCRKCRDVSSTDCKRCSCHTCGKKIFIDKLIICDECESTYHLFCLEPPLLEVPAEPEWYCPECKNDENEIVMPGGKLKSSGNKKNSVQDRVKVHNYFGPVFATDVGTWWNNRKQGIYEIEGSDMKRPEPLTYKLHETGIHGSFTSDIHGDEAFGVYSMILRGQSEGIQDRGYEFYYTVPSGRTILKSQSVSLKMSNQLPNRIIRMFALNCNNHKTSSEGFGKAVYWQAGKAIRVIRRHSLGMFAPKSGYRYDGIYKVVEYFPELHSECLVWRFLMRRDDPVPPPWKQIRIKIKEEPGEIGDLSVEQPKKKVRIDGFRIEDKLMNLIDHDSANEKIWSECKERAKMGKKEFIDKVKELFTCVCCQDVVYMPVTTDCKHNFCHDCLKHCFASKIYHCPSCRLELGRKFKITINRDLERALALTFPGYEFSR